MLKKILFLILFMASPALAEREDDIAEFNAAFAEYQNHVNNTGDIDAAILAAEEVYKLAPRLYGRKSEEFAIVTYNLAELHDLKGGEEQNENEEKASDLYEKYFRMQNLNKIPKDIEYINQYMPYMIAYYNTHPGNGKLDVSEKLLTYAEKLNLPENEMAGIQFLVGVKRAQYNGYDYSVENFEKALSLYNQDKAANAHQIGECLYWISKSYQNTKEVNIAKSKLNDALLILKESLRDSRNLKNNIFLELAVINAYQKDIEEAEINYKKIVIEKGEKAYVVPMDKEVIYMPLQGANRKFVPAAIQVQFDIGLDGYPINIEALEMNIAGGNTAELSLNPNSYKRYAIEVASSIQFLPPTVNGENKVIKDQKKVLIFSRRIIN